MVHSSLTEPVASTPHTHPYWVNQEDSPSLILKDSDQSTENRVWISVNLFVVISCYPSSPCVTEGLNWPPACLRKEKTGTSSFSESIWKVWDFQTNRSWAIFKVQILKRVNSHFNITFYWCLGTWQSLLIAFCCCESWVYLNIEFNSTRCSQDCFV